MSSSKAGPSLIHVPALFSIVEQGVYRSATPTPQQIPFLNSLSLKTIISLTPEHPTKPFLAFVRSNNIDFIHLGTTLWRPITDWKPIRDELVKSALEILLDTRRHPLLLIDPYVHFTSGKCRPEASELSNRIGIHQTGCVVGALRVMQGWNFASTLVEYRAHSGPTKHRQSDEQYIELFDPDLVNLPQEQYCPSWLPQHDPGAEDTDYEDEDVIGGLTRKVKELDVGIRLQGVDGTRTGGKILPEQSAGTGIEVGVG